MATTKYLDISGLTYLWQSKIAPILATKSDTNHTHERVNGIKIQVSTTAPTNADSTTVTFVK